MQIGINQRYAEIKHYFTDICLLLYSQVSATQKCQYDNFAYFEKALIQFILSNSAKRGVPNDSRTSHHKCGPQMYFEIYVNTCSSEENKKIK